MQQRFRLALAALALAASVQQSAADPVVMDDNIEMRHIMGVGSNPVRLAVDPTDNTLYLLKTDGSIRPIDIEAGEMQILYTSSHHGLRTAQGLVIGPDGTMYLTGFRSSGKTQVATVMRGAVEGDERVWTVLAQTEPYELSDSWYNHNVNGIAISPDGSQIYVNSGSRTDHGEVQDNGGSFPGLRESGLTAIMLVLPADGQDIVLPNDREALREAGYLYSEGLRNSFDLAFSANGELFATENGPNRDMAEEINWIRQGRHYGFPWRMGAQDTPQQFPGYDPSADPQLLRSQINAGNGLYADDPDYPAPPTEFTDPVVNMGPDADKYRDPETGEALDASDEGTTISTLTSHRSPLGLLFDTERLLAAPYNGDGFVLSWNGGDNQLIGPLGDPGQDLLHMELELVGDNYQARITRIVGDFANPIDAAFIGNTLYVIEHGGQRGLWEFTFPMGAATAVEETQSLPDGNALEQNYPNPFNPNTTIAYQVGLAGPVRLTIYDAAGQTIRTLVQGQQAAGRYTVAWDGRDASGQSVASGTYLYQLQIGDYQESRNLTLIK